MTAPPPHLLKQALHHLNWTRSILDETGLNAPEQDPEGGRDMSPAALLAECQALLDASPACPPPVIRSLHHMACSGGTLIAQMLGAQANVRLLSEVNPFSTQLDKRQLFRPSDVSFLARHGTRPVDQRIVQELFEAEVGVLASRSHQSGHILLLRDHAHSAYCLGTEPQKAPKLHDILTSRFETRPLVTVRHPLDCYLSLQANGWLHFTPATLDEYARRVRMFLHDHGDIAVLRYEDILADPEARMKGACDALDLPFDPQTLTPNSAIALSGGSGRHTARLGARPRRPVPVALRRMATRSPDYQELCARLGYAPAPDAPPVIGPLPPAAA
ncbi:MAG: sulfotransferase [Pseudomonadota bacterium]